MKKVIILIITILLFPMFVKADTSAQCAIIMDMDSGRILYAKNENTVRGVASISKIMTAVVALENGNINDVVTIGEEIKDAYGSGVYIRVGEEMKLGDLLYGLMLRSGNDAALAIAKHIGGSVDKFVGLMNEKAKEIGMNNSDFHNPSGLDEDEGNKSTAYDMAKLTSYAMKNSTYREIVKTKKHVVKTNMNTYSWTNKNKMLTIYPYVTGGKTGFTDVAKRTLVSTASKEGLNLVAVTLNDGNDFNDHKNLYQEYFNIYSSYEIFKKGDVEIIGDTYYLNYKFYFKDTYTYALNESEKKSVRLKFEIEKKHNYKDGDCVGVAKFFLGDNLIKEENVYIKKEKEMKPGLLHQITNWFRNLW